jgi:hypothetical protein
VSVTGRENCFEFLEHRKCPKKSASFAAINGDNCGELPHEISRKYISRLWLGLLLLSHKTRR